jgi:formylglycine-generating enzyme required for sulfatase activity
VWKAVEEYKNHPVTGVTWYGATDFCRELDSGLPTLAEWSKAASWHPVTKQTAPYPWGNASPSPERANYESNGTQPVGSYPSGRSVIGAYDMSGNVWELVADTIGTNRIWRGGGWDSPAGQITTTAETRKGASTASNNLGFRCARS